MVDAMTHDAAAETFRVHRRRLFGIAYRMLGSAADAEDVLQDAWLRWQAVDLSVVVEPAALLTTMTTRLSINALQAAYKRREMYVGPWLPEPVDTSADPQLGAERGQALSVAVLALLEKLSPTQRAAYVLREAFDYPFERIAQIIETSEDNVRQLISRAKKQLDGEKRQEVDRAEQQRLLEAFVRAAQLGDMPALEQLFTLDVTSVTDGNGARRAARVPVAGRERVARFVAGFGSTFWKDLSLRWLEVNGSPAVLLSREAEPVALLVLVASAQGIEQLMWVVNPDKLVAFGVRSTSN
jgi:RNA polymerase sigma-70 factor, ECF subfamily